MPVRETSIEAYRDLKESGELSDRQFEVLEYLAEYQEEREEDPTARELHDWLATDKALEEAQLGGPNYVKPRLTELKEMGYVEETGKRECSVTGRKAATLLVVSHPDDAEDDVEYIFDPDSDDEVDEVGDEEEFESLVTADELAGDDDNSSRNEEVEDDSEEPEKEKQTVLMEDGQVI